MFTTRRARQFRPTFDRLQARLTPSDVIPVSPTDPVNLNWDVPPADTVDISPTDTVIVGWDVPPCQ